jgi:hypothetical protein
MVGDPWVATKVSPRFSLTLGGRLPEPGLRSANEVYAPTGLGDGPILESARTFWDSPARVPRAR